MTAAWPGALAQAGEGAPPEVPLPCPDWTWATLGLRNLGGSFDRLANYCNGIAANAGPLVRLTATSWLFPLPLDAGFDLDAPALVFLLDPGLAGVPGEKAFLIPLADDAAVKRSLAEVFFAKEQDGVFKVLVPQGLGEPDQTVLVRVARKMLLAGPTQAVLKELAALADAGLPAKRISPRGPDALLAVNLAALRRHAQKDLEAWTAWAAQLGGTLWPSAAARLREMQARVLAKAQELDRLELRAAFSEQDLTLDLRLYPAPNTELMARWEQCLPAPTGAWLPYLSAETGLLVVGRLPPGWLPREDDLRRWLALWLPAASGSAEAAHARAAQAAGALAADLGSEVAFAVRVGPQGAVRPGLLLPARDGANLRPAFEAFVTAGLEVLNERLRRQFALKPDAPVPVCVRKVTADGAEPAQYEVEIAAPSWSAALKPVAEVPGLWPPGFCLRGVKEGLALEWGREAPSVFVAAPAGAVTQAACLPPGAAAWALVRPVKALRALLPVTAGVKPDAVARLLDQLSDAPLRAGWGAGGGQLFLRLDVPAASLHTGLECYLRMLRQGFDPMALIEARNEPPPQNVPAPPPGP